MVNYKSPIMRKAVAQPQTRTKVETEGAPLEYTPSVAVTAMRDVGSPVSPSHLPALQGVFGNQAVSRMVAGSIQRKAIQREADAPQPRGSDGAPDTSKISSDDQMRDLLVKTEDTKQYDEESRLKILWQVLDLLPTVQNDTRVKATRRILDVLRKIPPSWNIVDGIPQVSEDDITLEKIRRNLDGPALFLAVNLRTYGPESKWPAKSREKAPSATGAIPIISTAIGTYDIEGGEKFWRLESSYGLKLLRELGQRKGFDSGLPGGFGGTINSGAPGFGDTKVRAVFSKIKKEDPTDKQPFGVVTYKGFYLLTRPAPHPWTTDKTGKKIWGKGGYAGVEGFRIQPDAFDRVEANEAKKAKPVARRATDGSIQSDAEATLSEAAQASGAPLPDPLRSRFEASFGTDLSRVRIHSSDTSSRAAAAVSAQAYTTGQDIHFGQGFYNPDSASGQELLAHEVAHTVQHSNGPADQYRLEVSQPHDPAEIEAEQTAAAIMRGGPAHTGSLSADRQVARAVQDDAHAQLNASDQRALKSLSDILSAFDQGNIDRAFRILNCLWMRDMMFVLGRLQAMGRLKRDVGANLDKPELNAKYDIAGIRAALETVETCSVSAGAGAFPSGQKVEMQGYADVKNWQTILPKVALSKEKGKVAASGPEWDYQRQMTIDTIQLNRVSLLEFLASKHPGTPPRIDIKLDPKGVLLDALLNLSSSAPDVAAKLLDAGVAFQDGKLVAVNTELQAIESQDRALALINGSGPLAALLVEIANTKAGWGKAAPDVKDKGKPGWNAREWAVNEKGERLEESALAGQRFVRRIPLDNVKNSSAVQSGGASESAVGRAIVVVPGDLDPKKPLDILVHFHGNNIGYRQETGTGDARDVGVDKIEQQVLASGRANLIGILPQSTGGVFFGKFKEGSNRGFAGVDTDALITEVMGRLASLEPPVVPLTAKRDGGRTIISGHSGGGDKLAGIAGKKGKLPVGMNELYTFEAEPDKGLSTWMPWVLSALADDKEKLKALGGDSDKQIAHLKSGKRLRAYFRAGGYYVNSYTSDAGAINAFFTKTAKDTSMPMPSSEVWEQWIDNYQVRQLPFSAGHDAILGGDKLLDALKAKATEGKSMIVGRSELPAAKPKPPDTQSVAPGGKVQLMPEVGHSKTAAVSRKPIEMGMQTAQSEKVQVVQRTGTVVHRAPLYVMRAQFLGHNPDVNQTLAGRLAKVEQHLQKIFDGLDEWERVNPITGGMAKNVNEWCPLKRADGRGSGGKHKSGSAIDLNYDTNPYIATRTETTDPQGKRTKTVYGGEAAGKHLKAERKNATEVYDRAVQFASYLPGATSEMADVGERRKGEKTGSVYDRFRRTSDALKYYFSLAFKPDGPAKVQRPMVANPGKATLAQLLKAIPESERKSESDARADIKADLNSPWSRYRDTSRYQDVDALYLQMLRDYELVRVPMQFGSVASARPGSTRNPSKGFMDLRKELVEAMCDPNLGNLRWGASDFGAEASGDIMHFDLGYHA